VEKAVNNPSKIRLNLLHLEELRHFAQASGGGRKPLHATVSISDPFTLAQLLCDADATSPACESGSIASVESNVLIQSPLNVRRDQKDFFRRS